MQMLIFRRDQNLLTVAKTVLMLILKESLIVLFRIFKNILLK